MRCRSCLAQIDNTDINLNDPINDNLTYHDCFFMCTHLFIDKKDSLTAKLCKDCAEELKRILPFVQTAHESDKQFKKQKEQQQLQLQQNPIQNENCNELRKEDDHNVQVLVGLGEIATNQNQLENNQKEVTAADAAECMNEDTKIVPSKTQADSTEQLADGKMMEVEDDDFDDDFKPELVLCTLRELLIVNKRFKCQQCTEAFYRQTELNEHQERYHAFCTPCELSFSDNNELIQHNSLMHSHGVQFESPPAPNLMNVDQNHMHKNPKEHINKHDLCSLLPPNIQSTEKMDITNEGQSDLNKNPKEHTDKHDSSSLSPVNEQSTGKMETMNESQINLNNNPKDKTNKHDSSSLLPPNEQSIEKMEITNEGQNILNNNSKEHTNKHDSSSLSPPNKQSTKQKGCSSVVVVSKFHCFKCLKLFKSQHLLTDHEKTTHVKDPLQITFACEQCKREFSTQSALDYHCRVVHTERDNICEICGNAFKLKNQLKNHMKLHLEKNLHCQFCDKRYARNIDLIVHLRSHTGDKPYACHFCDKRFAIKVRLTYHLQRHLGIQHKCPHCGSVFNSRQKLKIHSYKHSGMPYRCEKCVVQRGFPSRETFRRHLKSIHQSMLSNEELDAMFKRNTGKTKRIVTIDEMIVPDQTP